MKIPIIKLRDILLTSVQEDLSDQDALNFQSDILQQVNDTETKGIVIDISAMELVDTFLARVLNETANMARLLGSEVVLCGMQPAVALTLVEMGRELIGVETALNLDQGMDRMSEILSGQRRPHADTNG